MPKCSSLEVFIHTVTVTVLKLLVFEALGNMTVMYPDELTTARLSWCTSRCCLRCLLPLVSWHCHFCHTVIFWGADPSADELRRLMMLHGGQFHVYYSRSKTTHIIATNLPNSKIQELKGEKVIRPEWITDRSVHCQVIMFIFHILLYNISRKPCLSCRLFKTVSKLGTSCPIYSTSCMANTKARSSLAWLFVRPQRFLDRAMGCFNQMPI